jgi:hypothetical protein
MSSSYALEPLIELTHWSVFEVPIHGPDAPWTRHFIGFAEELGLAQVSSAIVMFDREHGVGASASHRVFQLVGESGRHLESLKLWTRWKTLNGIHLERDITPGFYSDQKALRISEIA